MFNSGLGAAFIDTVMGASDSAVGKYITTRIGTYKYGIFLLGVGLIPTIIYFFFFANSGNISLTVSLLSILSGVLLAVGIVLYYNAIKTQQITNAAALGEVQPVILLLFGVFILGEAVTILEGLGALIIFTGAFLVITTHKLKVNWGLFPVVLANICWSVYWILMTYAIQGYGGESFPLLLSRTCGFVLLIAYAFYANKIPKTVKKPMSTYHKYILWFFILLSGFMDGFYNLLFGFIINVNIVAIAAALLAAGPILTAVLGRVFFGERLDARQKIGFVLAIVGAIFISL